MKTVPFLYDLTAKHTIHSFLSPSNYELWHPHCGIRTNKSSLFDPLYKTCISTLLDPLYKTFNRERHCHTPHQIVRV